MRPHLRAARIAAVALVALAVDVPLVLHAGAQVPGVPGSSGTSTSPAATPSPTPPPPTPCSTDITGVVCQAAGGPTPPPPASPTPTPTASAGGGTTPGGSSPPPGAAAAPAGSSPGQQGPPAAAAPGAPGAPAPPSAATIAQVAATFKNAPFLGQLLDILSHPTAAQRPDLHHFRPSGGSHGDDAGSPLGAALSAVTGSGTRGGTGGAVALSLLAMLLAAGAAVYAGSAHARSEVRRLVLAPAEGRIVQPLRRRVLLPARRLAIAAWRLHPTIHRTGLLLHSLAGRVSPHPLRLRRHPGAPRFGVRHHSHRGLALSSCVAALPALVLAVVLGGAGAHSDALLAAHASSTPAGHYLRTEVAFDPAVAVGQPVVTQPTWTRLVTIERGLVGQQDELTAQERAIARLAVNVGGQSPDDAEGIQVGEDSPPQLRNRLAMLVAAHTATQSAYQQSLQAEYDLYRAAAQDAAQREQLIAAAAAAAPQQPQAKEAVTYNLSLVQTQLAQEAQIAQAEGRLQALGSLGKAQLDAMRHHQPFIAPEVAPVTQGFGPTDFSLEPPLSFNGAFFPHFHTGLDLGAPLGTPIHAAADGVVLLAAASVDQSGKLVGYGNYVVIAHPDGFVTLYGHLDSIAVKAGQVIHQGEIVGLEGSTGWSTGPHVHFEIRHNGQFLDPAPFLAGQLPPG